MSRATHEPRVCAHLRSVEELSDADIDALVTFGRERAEIIDKIEEATRAGDKDLAWEYDKALIHVADEAGRV